jgi:hypothetical protein
MKNPAYKRISVKRWSLHILTTYSSLLISFDLGVGIQGALLPTAIANTTVTEFTYADVRINICLISARNLAIISHATCKCKIAAWTQWSFT